MGTNSSGRMRVLGVVLAVLAVGPARADWQTRLDTASYDVFGPLAERPDGGLVIAGGSTDMSRRPVPGRWAWLATLDGAGNLVETSTIAADASQVYTVDTTDGGGVALVAQDFMSRWPGAVPPTRTFVVRIAPDGTLAWSKTVSSLTESITPTWALEAPGGELLVHGLARSATERAWLALLAPDGRVRWQAILDPMAGFSAPTKAAISGDRALLVGWGIESAGSRTTWVGSVDLADGSLDAQVKVPLPDDGYLVGVAGDGTGGGWVTATNHGASYSTADAWIVGLDANLGIRHQALLGGPSAETLAPIAAPGGGALLVGRTLSWDGSNQAWLVRMESDGRIAWQLAGRGGFGAQALDDGTWLLTGSAPGLTSAPSHGSAVVLDDAGATGATLMTPARTRRAIHGRRFPNGHWALVDDSVDNPLGDGGPSTMAVRHALDPSGDCVFSHAVIDLHPTPAVPVPTTVVATPAAAALSPSAFTFADAPPMAHWNLEAEPGCVTTTCVAPPPIPTTLRVTAAGLHVDAMEAVSAWNVYEGSLDDFGRATATCHVQGVPDADGVVVPHAPARGTWILATGSNACGEGGAGVDSTGAERGWSLCGGTF